MVHEFSFPLTQTAVAALSRKDPLREHFAPSCLRVSSLLMEAQRERETNKNVRPAGSEE
jgi:hypothetical protein